MIDLTTAFEKWFIDIKGGCDNGMLSDKSECGNYYMNETVSACFVAFYGGYDFAINEVNKTIVGKNMTATEVLERRNAPLRQTESSKKHDEILGELLDRLIEETLTATDIFKSRDKK